MFGSRPGKIAHWRSSSSGHRGSQDGSRANDLLLVRINDVMEHITRVLNHALASCDTAGSGTGIGTDVFLPLMAARMPKNENGDEDEDDG